MYGKTVTESDFDTNSRNPRFVAYLVAKGLKPGDGKATNL